MTKYLQIQLNYFVLSTHYHFITLKYNRFITLKYNCFNTLKYNCFTALKRYPYKPIGVQGFTALKYEIPTKPIGIVGESGVHSYKGFPKISFQLLVKFFVLF